MKHFINFIIQVSLDEKEAHVEFDSGKTNEQTVVDKITGLGFKAQAK
jgi:copper chaperone CopZ